MQWRPAPTVYSIDAGGSRTVIAVARPGAPVETWVRESFAIASAGSATARSRLESVLREVCARVGPDSRTVGCIASSSMPVSDEAPAPASLVDVIAAYAPGGRVVLVNDVVPPLWSAPIDGVGVVLCSGTGSSVIGRDARRRLIKVGGHEHIVSDQGSAYSLAREGLRAAARDIDGTGPATKLRAAAEAFFGRPLPALGRWLAELPRARTTVASFAPCVTGGAADDDRVASEIVQVESLALVDAVQVAIAGLTLGQMPAIGLAGGVLHGSDYFRGLVERELVQRALADDARSNVHLLDGIAAGIQFALRLSEQAEDDADAAVVPDGVVLEIAS
jgi:N-acetylglucosamine kinase-like BadF-type ATPase